MILGHLQSSFQEYLMHGTIKTMLPQVAPDERFSAEKRLKVYFDSYRIRLMEILKLDFPKTHTLLGDENFENAFHAYLTQHTSTHFSVRYFGQHFSQFLATNAPYKDYPVFKEMAQFEWAVAYTIDAKDAPLINTEMLSSLSGEEWQTLSFCFHPSVTSCVFAWDTPQLWQHIDNEEPARAPVLQEAPIRWLLWRKGQRSLFRSCTVAEEKMFESILNKDNFAQICENLLDTVPEEEIPLTCAQTLFKWVSEDMISSISS